MPPSEITPTSVVPPPMSTTIEPLASLTGNPAPIAAAIGSSIRNTCEAPAASADSLIARRSTCVEPHGTQMMMRGFGANSLDVAGHLAEHLLGLLADGLDRALAVGTALLADCNDRRFVEHDALAAHVDQRVRGPEVDRQVVGEIAAEKTEHELPLQAGLDAARGGPVGVAGSANGTRSRARRRDDRLNNSCFSSQKLGFAGLPSVFKRHPAGPRFPT